MVTFNQIFQAAQIKGYKPHIVFIRKAWGDGSGSISHTELDSYSELCELTLIQKWLRDEHYMYVSVSMYNVALVDKIGWDRATAANGGSSLKTYEQALLEGINEALKLI